MKTVSCALRNRPHAQRGLTLLVALVVLAALGLLAAWGLKAGGANMRVVGNMQARQQALSAAQSALESTISSAQFSQQPATVAAQPIAVDIDGDGVADITARLSPAPACYRVRIVSLSELDAASAAEIGRAHV